MDRKAMLDLVRYHAWANDRILATAAELSDEQLRHPEGFDHESAFQTLRHLLDSDWSWREFLASPAPEARTVWDAFALDDLPSVRAFFTEEHARLAAYVESLDDASLDESVQIGPRLDGGDHVRPRWFVLAHVVNHGTQHRSELARYLTDVGHSPDQLDLIGVPYPTEG